MLIDCGTCQVRGQACAGCVVSVLFGEAPHVPGADQAERRALQVLADAGFEVTVLATEERRRPGRTGPASRRGRPAA